MCQRSANAKMSSFVTMLTTLLMVLSVMELARQCEASSGKTGAVPGDFEMYVLELTWTADFCCFHSSNKQCTTPNPDSFSSKHLTLHGLWP